jgi:hypothetical protein
MQPQQNPNTHVSTAQAQQQKLPGSDSFRHSMYYDAGGRDFAAVRLNEEALKAFFDTVIIRRRNELAGEMAAWKQYMSRGGFASGDAHPVDPATTEYVQYINYENLKIACGFELHLKARLVSRDFVVHEVDDNNQPYKTLATDQKKRPITTAELLAIDSYRFDGSQNYLPGLKDNSINFKLLTQKAAYKQALNLQAQHLDIIEYYRCLRNQIHLTNEFGRVPTVQFPGTVVDFITTFINTEIIPLSNTLGAKYNMRFALHNPLS